MKNRKKRVPAYGRIYYKLSRLLYACETEPDFSYSSRHFLRAGEFGLAFEELMMFLFTRDDLWQKHHALIKSTIRLLKYQDEVEVIEFRNMDNAPYYEHQHYCNWLEAAEREALTAQGHFDYSGEFEPA